MDSILIFKALADETRQRILRLLLSRNYCVRALARCLDLTEAAISQHLKTMREAGLLIGRKRAILHTTASTAAFCTALRPSSTRWRRPRLRPARPSTAAAATRRKDITSTGNLLGRTARAAAKKKAARPARTAAITKTAGER
jgi:biotin operon repressor